MAEFRYPDLVNNYLTFCNYKRESLKSSVVDLKSASFFYPSTLLPLATFIKTARSSIQYIAPLNQNCANYFDIITGEFSFQSFDSKSYIPLINLPKDESKSDVLVNSIFEIHNNGKDYGGQNPFKFLIGELIDNIYQHSEFSNATVMAQRYEKQKFVEICFFDDGITINGSYKKAGMGFSDEDAICEALRGVSVKSKDRGFGLSGNLNLITKSLKGKIFIVSGSGGFYATEGIQKLYKFQDTNIIQGTLIAVRLPFPAKEVQNDEFYEQIS